MSTLKGDKAVLRPWIVDTSRYRHEEACRASEPCVTYETARHEASDEEGRNNRPSPNSRRRAPRHEASRWDVAESDVSVDRAALRAQCQSGPTALVQQLQEPVQHRQGARCLPGEL